MKHYRIENVEGDSITLCIVSKENNKVTVDVEELAEFAKENKVYGYNAITGKLAVTSKEEAIKQYFAKYRLIGKEPTAYVYGTITLSDIDKENGTVRATLLFKDIEERDSIFDTITLSLDKGTDIMYEKINNKFSKEKEVTVYLDVVFDIGSYETLMYYNDYYNHDYGFNYALLSNCRVVLNSVVFKERFDLKETVAIVELFSFLEDFYVDVKGREKICIDLSAYTLENIKEIKNMFKCVGKARIKYPKVNLKDKNHTVTLSNLYELVVQREENFLDTLKFLICIKRSQKGIDSIGDRYRVSEVHLSNLFKLDRELESLGYQRLDTCNAGHTIEVNNLIVDCEISGSLFKVFNNLRLEVHNLEFVKGFTMPIYEEHKEECDNLIKIYKSKEIIGTEKKRERTMYRGDWYYNSVGKSDKCEYLRDEDLPRFLEDTINSFTHSLISTKNSLNHRDVKVFNINMPYTCTEYSSLIGIKMHKGINFDMADLFLLCMTASKYISLTISSLELIMLKGASYRMDVEIIE